ncbi:MAG: LacI family transcriptional regulator [Paludibacteraceae bacterium]|nr:LacI family transcriptional regulator [Paludibacteraceae bacterium]
MKSQITIKDIAKALNISISTVSRALNGNTEISKATRDKVQSFAQEHHYKPNAIALSLKMRHSNLIGVIIPEIVHHFFSSVISGIEDTANDKGYTVVICQSSENYYREVKCIETLMSAHVSGVLASISKEVKDFSHYKELMEDGTPLVFYDRFCPDLVTDHVVADDYSGAFQAVDYLVKSGCRKIALFRTGNNITIAKDRTNGYLDAIKANGIMVDDSLIFECDNRDNAITLTEKIIKSNSLPDAFFAVNDDTASGIIYALKLAGKKIPQDVSVCGFGDGIVAQISDPTITTVEQNGYEMGVEACKLLIARIENKDSLPITQETIPTRLILRESTK